MFYRAFIKIESKVAQRKGKLIHTIKLSFSSNIISVKGYNFKDILFLYELNALLELPFLIRDR